MPRLIHDGEVRVTFAPTIADPNAPTVAEVETGATVMTPFIQTLDTPLDGDTVDASDLSSAYNVTAPGTFGGNPVTGTFHKDSVPANDTAYTTLPRLTTGFFVIRRFGGSGVAIAISDPVEVWPINVITRNPSAMNRNTLQTFTLEAAVSSPPSLDVAVV